MLISATPYLTPQALSALEEVFGDPDEEMDQLVARARPRFPIQGVILWEGDAETFRFSFVGGDAEVLLGYPAARWLEEPTFWSDIVVHPDDQAEAVAYCALATGRRCDHAFEYRAKRADGQVVWLLDVVKVVLGPKGIPVRLRGIMFDITAQKQAEDSAERPPQLRSPSVDTLHQMAV